MPVRKYNTQEEWRIATNANLRRRKTEGRTAILKLLGDQCIKCGFSDVRALQIDHVHGDGYKTNKKLGSFARLLVIERDIQAGNIDKYQLLCANCNQIKRWEESEWAQGDVRLAAKAAGVNPNGIL